MAKPKQSLDPVLVAPQENTQSNKMDSPSEALHPPLGSDSTPLPAKDKLNALSERVA